MKARNIYNISQLLPDLQDANIYSELLYVNDTLKKQKEERKREKGGSGEGRKRKQEKKSSGFPKPYNIVLNLCQILITELCDLVFNSTQFSSEIISKADFI